MKSEDAMILGAAALLAVGLVWYVKKTMGTTAAASSSGSASPYPFQWASADYFPSVPYNYQTTIPMQPGGGY